MMRWIVGSSLRNRFLVILVAAAVMLAGITQVDKTPVDVLPEFAPPYVEIQTEALGLSALEVESLVTLNLEELLNGLPWLQTIRSRSVPGLSSLILVFEPGTDIFRARQLIQERLILTHMLPNVSKPPVVLQPLSATSRVMVVGFSSKDVSPIEMSVLAHWKIRPTLLGVPGVANVAIWGQRNRQLQVQVDPERLRAHGVSLDQVIATTGNSMWVSPLSFLNASTPGTGGWIDTPNQRLEVRHVLPIASAEDLAKVAVDGTALRLGDVAEVVENHQPLIGDALLKDGPGLLMVIEKFPAANTLQVTRGVEAALEKLQPGLSGITFDSTVFRPATYIEGSIGNLSRTLLIGALLVVLVLGLFLFDWRVVLIILVAIPLSLTAAALVLYLRGATINTMVLAGFVIALGVVVDDAVVDVENIVRRLRQHRLEGGTRPAAAVVLNASLEMRGAIIFATLIVALAVVPVFFLEGVSGAFFGPLALSYVLAVLASMAVALTVTPALALLLLTHTSLDRRESPLVHRLQRGYAGSLTRIIRTPRPAYLAVGALLLAGLVALPFMGQSFLPAFRERDLLVQWSGAPGTSHPAMTRLTAEAGRELQAIPGVRNFGALIGRAVLGDRPVGINSAELWVSVDPTADYDATVGAVQDATAGGFPGTVREVRTYLQEKVREVLTGTSDAIVVRIFGPDLDVLREKAEEVREEMAKINGVAAARVELQVEEPQVEIEVDLERAEAYGLKPGDVRRAASTLLSGLEAGNLFEEQKVFDVVVWGTPATRHSLTSIRELLIDTPGGDHVRLEDVADVRLAPTPNMILREAVSRRIDIGLTVQGRDLAAVANDVEDTLEGIDFPLEHHAQVLGEDAERQGAQNRMLGFAVAAAAGIFLLLQAALQSWRLATLVFFTLPVALVGGVLAAFATGGAISLGTLVGLLAVFGIAARNGILLISHYQRLEEHEGEVPGMALVLRGARERLVPIALTAATTGLALAPLVVAGNIAGHEMAHPVAITILGGLVTSTLLNLFIMPALYLRLRPVGQQPVPYARPEPTEPITPPTARPQPAHSGAAD
jgi:CzcA family heavy metal efflux pump